MEEEEKKNSDSEINVKNDNEDKYNEKDDIDNYVDNGLGFSTILMIIAASLFILKVVIEIASFFNFTSLLLVIVALFITNIILIIANSARKTIKQTIEDSDEDEY